LESILTDESKFIKINVDEKYLKPYGDAIVKNLIPSGSNPGKFI